MKQSKKLPPPTVVVAPPTETYVTGLARVRIIRPEDEGEADEATTTEQAAVAAISGAGVGYQASEPNILSKKARHRLVLESQQAAQTVVLASGAVALVVVVVALLAGAVGADSVGAALASNWFWPLAFGLIAGVVLWLVSYSTVMGFGKVSLSAGFNPPGASGEDAGETDDGKDGKAKNGDSTREGE